MPPKSYSVYDYIGEYKPEVVVQNLQRGDVFQIGEHFNPSSADIVTISQAISVVLAEHKQVLAEYARDVVDKVKGDLSFMTRVTLVLFNMLMRRENAGALLLGIHHRNLIYSVTEDEKKYLPIIVACIEFLRVISNIKTPKRKDWSLGFHIVITDILPTIKDEDFLDLRNYLCTKISHRFVVSFLDRCYGVVLSSSDVLASNIEKLKTEYSNSINISDEDKTLLAAIYSTPVAVPAVSSAPEIVVGEAEQVACDVHGIQVESSAARPEDEKLGRTQRAAAQGEDRYGERSREEYRNASEADVCQIGDITFMSSSTSLKKLVRTKRDKDEDEEYVVAPGVTAGAACNKRRRQPKVAENGERGADQQLSPAFFAASSLIAVAAGSVVPPSPSVADPHNANANADAERPPPLKGRGLFKKGP